MATAASINVGGPTACWCPLPDEESEGEELREAAKAYTAASRPLKAAQPEVIVLDDSSDDEQLPHTSQQAVSRAAGQLAGIASSFANAGNPQRPSAQSYASASSGSQGSATARAAQQGSSWASASSNRQLPASFQAGAGTAPSNQSNGPLRIKLPTRQPDRRLQQPQPPQQQQQQLPSLLPSQPMSNGTHGPAHPADPASSAGRLAARVAMRPPAPRHGSNSLGKRKHYELDGQYGAYSQASAQASGMSMGDHMQQAMQRSSGSRLPPYPDTSVSYPHRAAHPSASLGLPSLAAQPQPYGQYPNATSSEYWQSVGSPTYGQAGMGSPSYRSSMPSSPPYSPRADARYGRQPTMHERDAAAEAAVLDSLQPPAGYASGPPYWNPQPLPDGEGWQRNKCLRAC